MTPDDLKQWMAREGYTITSLASELGKSRQTLYDVLSGKRPIKNPVEFKWALRGLECRKKHK